MAPAVDDFGHLRCQLVNFIYMYSKESVVTKQLNIKLNFLPSVLFPSSPYPLLH